MHTRTIFGFRFATTRRTMSCILPWKSFTKYPNPGARPALMSAGGERVSMNMLTAVRSVGLSATSFPPTLTMRKSSSVMCSRMKMS